MSYLLLSGATGLLGRYLLRDLLAADAPVAVLARRSPTAAASRRIDAILRHWEAASARAWPRPVVLEADLALPDLGLGSRQLDWIGRHVDRVLHCAASLSFYARSPDDEPFRTNVEGTRRLLALARSAGVERFFHVSTAYVAGLRAGRVLEDELDVGQNWGNDYERGKVEAERLVRAAGFRHPPTIFRPAIIVGDSKTAYTSTYHGFYAPLKAALAIAAGQRGAPSNPSPSFKTLLGLAGDERKNLVPVDWVSSVITHILARRELHGRCYHLTHPTPTRVADIEDGLIEAAVAGGLTSVTDTTRDDTPDAAAGDAPLAGAFREQMQTYRAYFRDDPTFDTTNTRAAAPHLPCPAVERPLIARLAQAAIRANFGWPKPPEPPLAFDTEAVLARNALPGAALPDDGPASRIGLRVTGSGGGQWQLAFHGDVLAEYEPGLPAVAIATCSLTTETLRALCAGEITSDEAICSGRMLVERQPGQDINAARLIQQCVRPEPRAPRAAVSDAAPAHTSPAQTSPAQTSPAHTSPAHGVPALRKPLAIVGMACRLPGADGLDAYWDLLARGGDAVAELPAHRLDRSLYFDARKGVRGKTYSTLGGSISERPLDTALCPLPPEVVASADPAHVILCEVAAAACRHAGYDPFALPSRDVGVYVGHSAGSELATELMLGTLAEHWAESLRQLAGFRDWSRGEQDAAIAEVVARIRRDKPRRDAAGGPHLEANAVASLVARAFGLDGPQMAVDAACASSLTALTLAAMALERGAIGSALVGGASYNKCVSLLLFSQAHSCSATGSRPFDADADGLVSSEGYVVLLVKTLERALADGDRVHAVIRGLGMSSDGRGRSLWAPRKEGQIEAMRRAYGPDARLGEVQYIETHATSTQVGDATEVEALASVFRERAPGGGNIPIGSVKSNIGHTLETAGLAGLLKVVLAMKAAQIPASIQVRNLNAEVDWRSAPFEVATSLRPWPAPALSQPRTAAVNAFGIGGLNIHVVLSEFIPSEPSVESPGRVESRAVAKVENIDRVAASSGSLLAANPEGIAIIGRGVILPGARSLDQFWELLSHGRDATSEVPSDRWRREIGYRPGAPQTLHSAVRRGGFIRDYAYDWQKHNVPPRQVKNANPLQFMLLDAADQALNESGYHQRSFDRQCAAVVVGTMFGGDFCTQLNLGLRCPELARYLSGVLADRGESPERIAGLCEELARFVDRTTPALHDETGSFTSSTLALRLSKTFDLMGGAMAIDSGSASSLSALAAASDLLLSGRCDLVMCAAAQQAMDLPSFEMLSLSGLLTDSAPKAPFDPNAQGYVPGEGVVVLLLKRLSAARRDGDRVFGIVRGVGVASHAESLDAACVAASRRAHVAAGVASQAITAIEAGCAVPRHDRRVAAALQTVYGGEGRAAPLRVGSTVAQFGHLQGAQGLVAVVKATLEHEHRRLLPMFGIGSPAPESSEAAVFRLAIDPVELAANAPPSFVAISSTGRGGLAYEAVLECPVGQEPSLRNGAPVVVKSHPILSEGGHSPLVAFVFPGQGSQYPGMLRRLVADDPAARAAAEHANEILARLGYPTFTEISADANGLLGKDIWTTQIAMLVADSIFFAALAARGVRPDRVTGHSFGEFAALVAAGAWTLETAIAATRSRSEAVAACSDRGALLATAAAPERLASIAAKYNLAVAVTHRNSPSQTVVGGSESAIAGMLVALGDERVAAERIEAPCAFHTPLMAAAQAPLRTALAALNLAPPRFPFLAGVGNCYLAEPDQIRASLVAQLVEPVQWIDQIRRLANEGVRLFIEVGPRQTLTRLTRRILGSGAEVIACDHLEHGAEQLDRVVALWQRLGGRREPGDAPASSIGRATPATEHLPPVEHFDATRARREQARSESRLGRRAAPFGPEIDHFDATAPRRRSNARGGHGAAAIQPAVFPPAVIPPAENARPGIAPRAVSSAARLEAILIDFVVEQTGYPPAVVRLDADLEADLGIDSIKKAQLFGELREQFDIRASGKLKLSDFTTLRGISQFLESSGAVSRAMEQPLPATAASANAAVPAMPTALRGLETPAPAAAPATAVAVKPALNLSDDRLAAQLVDFVIEQTGYPPEVVRFEADLEADLGIDSIKKAQLFGELREQHSLKPRPGLKLSDFPTLGHILKYLRANIAQSTAVQKTSAPEPFAGDARDSCNVRPMSANREPLLFAADIAVGPRQRVIELSGSPYEMGRQHGLAMSREVKTLLRRIVELPSPWRPGFELTSLAAAAPFVRPEELEELRGIADGAGVELANVIAHNLSFAPDYAAGCAQFAVTAAANGGEMLHGVNEDAPLALRVPSALTRIVQSRRPSGGGAYVTFSIAGQFGGFNGVSSSGLAVTSTLLLDRGEPRPSAVGLVHAAVVKAVLEGAVDLESAVERVRDCRRLGAWSMCLSHHPTDRLCYLEYDHQEVRVDHDVRRVLSTNHSLLGSGANEAPAHSTYRLARLASLLGSTPLTLAAAQAALRDRHDNQRGRATEHATMNTVCRIDNQVSIVMRPSAGEIWATPGSSAGDAADTFLPAPFPRPNEPAPFPRPNDPAAISTIADFATAETAPRRAESGRVAARYLLRMAEKPLPPHPSPWPAFCGAALLVGDNPAVDALRTLLDEQGVRVFVLREIDDPDRAVAELDRVWSIAPAPHLFLLTPRDPLAVAQLAEPAWRRRQMAGVLGPYLLCQRWMKLVGDAGLLDRASLVAATSLGGDFGFSGQITSVESGALAGLLKSVAIENWVAGYRAIPVKIIDAPADHPAPELARAMLRELAASSYDLEIGYGTGKRRVPRAILAPAPASPLKPIARGGAWVCTGGARGITAFVATELALRYGFTPHLLGTAPSPQIPPGWRELSPGDLKQLRGEVTQRARREERDPLEAWRDVEKAIEIDATLRAMAAQGIRATYHSCDVADRTALAKTLAAIRAADGPITGILHGAGVGKDTRFDRKERRKVEQCIRAKTDGAAALMELTADDPLRYFVAFGSISGRFGANGHTDYSLANDMLAKQVGWLRSRRPDCAAVAFHWHAWGDVGMATKPETRLALELIDMQFMPAREGLEHLIAELEAGAPEGEVLITDDRYYRLFFHAETLMAAGQTSHEPAPLALLAEAEIERDGAGVAALARLNPTQDPFLVDHCLGGRPLLPVAVSLELLAEAARVASGGGLAVELRRLDILQSLKFHTDEPRAVRVAARMMDANLASCRLTADVITRDGQLVEADRMLLKGEVVLGGTTGGDSANDLAWSAAPAAGWQAVAYPPADAMFYVGPTLRCLRKVAFEPGRVWGQIVAPALVELAGPRRRVEGWQVPSALIDACLHAVGTLAAAQGTPGMSLPRACERLRLGRLPQPGELCLLQATFHSGDDREATFDFCLRGGDGQMLLAAEGYRVCRLGAS